MPPGATRKSEGSLPASSIPAVPRESALETPPVLTTPARTSARSWAIAAAGVLFALLQSLCTAVISISGLRALIGIGSLTAASGLLVPLGKIHDDAIRIPMMALGVAGSLINLYVIWRIRSLRARPSSQWRAQAIPVKQRRGEVVQIVLAVTTLLLVAAEIIAHRIVQHHF